MQGNLAFTFRCCNKCVKFAKRYIEETGSRKWWEIEVMLRIHIPNHPYPRRTVQIYPTMRDIRPYQGREITGMLFVNRQALPLDMQIELENTIWDKFPIGIRDVQKRIWKEFEPYWLELEIFFASGMENARLSVIDHAFEEAMAKL